MIHDYTRKRGTVHSEILLPPNAPPDFQDRGTLWNSVEQIEKACNSQLAQELEVALPIELSGEEQVRLDCSLHRKHKEKCNGHFIRIKVLERLVLKHIQAVMGYILRHEDYFRTIMEEQLRMESCEQIRIRRERLESNERRIAELKRLFIKIYEDNANGQLTDERYDMLSQTYEAEQKQLEAEAITLQKEIEVQERQNENIEKFIQKAHKYVGIEELDGYALRELVSAIYVDAPDKSSGKRVQHIHIKYDGLGFIPLNELMKKETA